MPRGELYRAHRAETAAGGIDLLFRDRELSDRIGFAYSMSEPHAAVEDLLGRARQAALLSTAPRSEPALVPICLDGENAWASYEGQGEPFLTELFGRLARDPQLAPRSVGGALLEASSRGRLAHLHSGSWIDADFHIWMGDPVKNRAWELLAETHALVRAAEQRGELPADRLARADDHLLAAQGSDWFWWFGEPFHSAEDPIFDRIFRAHLIGALEALDLSEGRPLVDALRSHPISLSPAAQPAAGERSYEEPYALIRPRIDAGSEGRPAPFYAWQGAGRYEVPKGAAMAEVPVAERLRFGFDREQLYLRVELASGRARELEAGLLVVDVQAGDPKSGRHLRLRAEATRPTWQLSTVIDQSESLLAEGGPVVWRRRVQTARDGAPLVAVELAVRFELLGVAPGTPLELRLQLLAASISLGRIPVDGGLRLTVPDEAFEADHWSA
jgi:hypothetical protein